MTRPSDTQQLDTASWPRRFLALAVDWVACIFVVVLVVGWDGWLEGESSGIYVLGVFVLQSALFTGTIGGSFGQMATRLRVVRVDPPGAPLGLLKAVARQVLVALVVPPLVFRPDGRGLHDLAVGSACVTLGTWKATQQ